MTGTRETAGRTAATLGVSSSTGAGAFGERFRNRRRGVGGSDGGVGAGGASPEAAKRRATTKIAIPPRMYGVSDTGA